MEVEPRIVKQYYATNVVAAKITVERRWRVGGGKKKKDLCVGFWLTRRSRVSRRNAFWGILKHEQQVIAYCQTQYDYGPP